ncbi:MAG: response regulator [Alphaproteobacteria bacterium]|nr:response regulator [Alphaproteobacteria bacterium]
MTRILIAEDDDALRRYLPLQLVRAGRAVEDAANGGLALEILEREAFDVLLTDVVMPEVDGIARARRAAVINPMMCILLITGFAAAALQVNQMLALRMRLLSKPFHLRRLVEEIDGLLAPP